MRQSTEPHHSAFPSTHNVAGLSKREWLAGMALQGILAHPEAAAYKAPTEAARGAVECADALIAALNERSG